MALNKRVLITTVPFGEVDPAPLTILQEAEAEFILNPLKRKLKENELAELIGGFDILIAGTEPITEKVLARAADLKFISRVGIGLDSVDLIAAKKRGVQVSYTPDAPSSAVSELTIGMIVALLRRIPETDRDIKNSRWRRLMGRQIADCVVGVIGMGRIGKRVVQLLRAFGPKILANDLCPDEEFGNQSGIRWVDKNVIYQEADVITLHVPLTRLTKGLIAKKEIETMKSNAVLLNTSRGGIINETDLAGALRSGTLAGAALDVFEEEPYVGELAGLENCLLTAHMGSMSESCRKRMEREAAEEVLRFIRGEPLHSPVPEAEYDVQRQS